MLERPPHVGAEHLEVDDRPQAELRTRDRGRAAVTAVAHRRHARGEAFGRSELGDVDVCLPADARLPLNVQRDPLRKVAQPVAEAAVDRIFEMRMRVDEPRNDGRIVEADPFAQLFGRADGSDAIVLDRNGATLDRRALDRQDPVS